MIPIHELLSRIRWDKTFAAADFVIGYYDRINHETLHVPFSKLSFPAEEHFRFVLVDEDGVVHNIPYHRVVAVYRNGELIWHRELKGLQ